MDSLLIITIAALGMATLVGFAIAAIWRTKAWGQPRPQRLSGERLGWCLHDVETWLKAYHQLPEDRQRKLLERFQRRTIYLRELKLESLRRRAQDPDLEEHYRKRILDKYLPIDERALELAREGLPEWEADKQAHEEWMQQRTTTPFRSQQRCNP